MARRKDLAGLAALAGLGMLMARKKAGADSATKPISASETKETAKESASDIADEMYSDYGSKKGRGAAGTSETESPEGFGAPGSSMTVKPSKSATTAKPSAATGLKNPGTGNQRGPTAEELAAYNLATENRRKIREGAQGIEGVYPESNLIAPGLKTAHSIAKGLASRFGGTEAKAASPYLKELPYSGAKQLPNAPTKQITGPSKGELVARDRAARAAARNEEMLRENARRSGLDPDNINPEVAKRVREGLGGSDFSLGMKKGGKVKGYANGGSVGSASKRGDGIASRGKTKCKMY